MRDTKQVKQDIINNFIDWFTSDEKERERMKSAALDYVVGDHVDEIAQSCPTWEQLRDAFFAGTSSFDDVKFIEALFAEYNKSYKETKAGQVYPRWLDDEQLKWVLTVAKNCC